MATAAMTGFGDGMLPSEWSPSGSGCRDVNLQVVGWPMLDEKWWNEASM